MHCFLMPGEIVWLVETRENSRGNREEWKDKRALSLRGNHMLSCFFRIVTSHGPHAVEPGRFKPPDVDYSDSLLRTQQKMNTMIRFA